MTFDEFCGSPAAAGLDEQAAFRKYLQVERDNLHEELGFSYTPEQWAAIAADSQLTSARALWWLRRNMEVQVGYYVRYGPGNLLRVARDDVYISAIAKAAKTLLAKMKNYPLSYDGNLGLKSGDVIVALLPDLIEKRWNVERRKRGNAELDPMTEELIGGHLYFWTTKGGHIARSFDTLKSKDTGPLIRFLRAATASAFERHPWTRKRPLSFASFVRSVQDGERHVGRPLITGDADLVEDGDTVTAYGE